MAEQSKFKNEFSWSKSRDNLFKTCQRAYYYHYYGSWNGWLADAPSEIKELYIMKNLETIPMCRGRIVHEVLEGVVGGIKGGTQWSVDEAVRMARQRAQRDFEDSRSGAYRSWPKRLCGLQDHYYGVPITDEALEAEIAAMEACVKMFYGTPTYERVLELGPNGIIESEKLQSMVLSGFKVWVKPDLILRDLDRRVTVVDWKTGLPSATGETELQLAIYGLYAVEAHGLTPEQLSGLEVNLRSGEEHFYALDKETLEGARLYIENSADRMQALLYDPQENIALIRDFPKVDDLYLCKECRFRRACDPD